MLKALIRELRSSKLPLENSVTQVFKIYLTRISAVVFAFILSILICIVLNFVYSLFFRNGVGAIAYLFAMLWRLFIVSLCLVGSTIVFESFRNRD